MSSRTGHGGDVSTDELFAVLGDAHRRQVMFCLREQCQPMTVAELGEAVIEREGESLDGSVDFDDHPVATALYHVHLPKLFEAGLIRWADDGMVAYDDPIEAVESLFELLERGDCFDAAPS